MTYDTKIGGPGSQFPATQWSAIQASKSENQSEKRRGFEVIVAAYWKPVYKLIRIKWQKSNEDAKDLTQGFFTKAIEKDYFHKYDPQKARFRTFLRTCLDGFLANEEKAANRVKRGGGLIKLSLDFESAETELQHQIPAKDSLDDYFEKEWERNLFTLSLEELRLHCNTEGKIIYFEIFERYDLNESEKVSYENLAAEFNLPVTKVTNYLAYARRELRRILLIKLREVTTSENEFQSEARSLLGIDLK